MSKSRVKRLAAQMVGTPPEKLVEIIDRQRTEISRLTAALADAKAENAELSDMLAAQLQVPRLAKLVIENDQLRAQLAQQRWRSVAEEMPTVDGNYLVRDFPPDVGAEVMILARDAINPGCWDFWFGPLPDLPSSEEQAK